jgi:hypothetical protein
MGNNSLDAEIRWATNTRTPGRFLPGKFKLVKAIAVNPATRVDIKVALIAITKLFNNQPGKSTVGLFQTL